jgi:hypothetical protein
LELGFIYIALVDDIGNDLAVVANEYQEVPAFFLCACELSDFVDLNIVRQLDRLFQFLSAQIELIQEGILVECAKQ